MIEINYIDAPDGAQNAMTAVGERGNSLSDAALIPTGATDIPYATLEPGVWKLDGTRRILSDAPRPGWWSQARSGSQGVSLLGSALLGSFILGDGGASRSTRATTAGNRFTLAPKITLRFSEIFSASGFTFTFSPSTDQWCSEIHVAWSNGPFPILEKTYFPDSPQWVLEEVVDGFDTMEISLLATNNPGQFAKIQRIEVGRTILFRGEDIVSASLYNEQDPSLCELSADTMSVEIMHRETNLLPQENQRMELKKDGVLLASHYIRESTRHSKYRYSIECQSVIGLLTEEFLGGMYDEVPVDTLVSEILGGREYYIDSSVANRTITGYLPVCTQREALQQVAFAAGAVVSTLGTTAIRLLPIPSVVTNRFTTADIALGGTVTTEPRYANIDVTYHQYVQLEESEELIKEEAISGTDVLRTFKDPHHSYEITGGTITGSGVNWVKITADGVVTLTGKKYDHRTNTYTAHNHEATARERSNRVSVEDCTLIHVGNVEAAAYRLYTAKQRRQRVEQNVVITDQAVGKIVSTATPWDTRVQGYLSAADHQFTRSGHTAKIVIQGVEVAAEAVWAYAGELYAGDTEVLY